MRIKTRRWWYILPILIAFAAADKVILLNTKQNRGSSNWRYSTCSDFRKCRSSPGKANAHYSYLGWAEQTLKLQGQRQGTSATYQAISVCDIAYYKPDTEQPDLWAISPFIEKEHRNARYVDIELKTVVNICQKKSPSFCRNYVDIYYKELDDDEVMPKVSSFKKLGPTSSAADTVEFSKGNTRKFGTKLTVGPIRTKGFVIAFRDRGSCTAIGPIVISYNFCPGQVRSLARFPTSFYDPTHRSSQVKGECVANSNANQVYMTCGEDGEWSNYQGSCVCNEGFEPESDQDQKCLECGMNSYKNTVSNDQCQRCPRKSWTAGRTGATECTCVDGHYRIESEGPHVPCSSVPSAPRNLTLTAASTNVELNWRMPDDIGGRFDTMRYRIDVRNEATGSSHTDSPFTVLGATNFYIPSLEPSTPYSFTVTAYNAVTRFHFNTMEEALKSNSSTTASTRTKPIFSASAIAFTPTKVQLEWPIDKSKYTELPPFDIFSDAQNIQNKSSTNTAWLTGLEPGRKYKVTILPNPLSSLDYYAAELTFITPEQSSKPGVVIPVTLTPYEETRRQQQTVVKFLDDNVVLVLVIAVGVLLSIVAICICCYVVKRDHDPDHYDDDTQKLPVQHPESVPFNSNFEHPVQFTQSKTNQFTVNDGTWNGYYHPGAQAPQYSPPGGQNRSSSTIYTNVLEDKVMQKIEGQHQTGGPLKNYVSPEEVIHGDFNEIVGQFSKGKRFLKEVSSEQLVEIGQIGEGNYGTVFQAQWDERMVAVKKLTVGAGVDDEVKDSFLREAAILAQLNNEFVVSFLGVQYQQEPVLFVTEFMEHGSLQKFVRTQCAVLQNSTLLRLLTNVSEGMHYLTHSIGYTHRDLAARNCLVGYSRLPAARHQSGNSKRHSNSADEGVVVVSDTDSDISRHFHESLLVCKIGDFGNAKPLNSHPSPSSNCSSLPLRWCAPEAWDGNRFSEKSDVWSFGVLAYEVLSRGERPFWNLNDFEVQKVLTNNQIINLTQVLQCPAFVPVSYFHQIIAQCLHYSPDNRPKFSKICKILKNLKFTASQQPLFANPDNETKIEGRGSSSSLSLWLAHVRQIPYGILYSFLQHGVVTVEQVQTVIQRGFITTDTERIDEYTLALLKSAVNSQVKKPAQIFDEQSSLPPYEPAFLSVSKTDEYISQTFREGTRSFHSHSFSYQKPNQMPTTLGVYNHRPRSGHTQHYGRTEEPLSRSCAMDACMVVEV